MDSEEKVILENLIKRYQYEYYVLGESTVSDKYFDTLWDKLKEKFPDSEVLKVVGNDISPTALKLNHKMVMGSQEKFNTKEGLYSWFKNKNPKFPIILQEKLDGISAELQYSNGKLIHALTRGNGFIGEDITSALIKTNSFPLTLNENVSCSVRGEVVIRKDLFKELYEKDFANARNFCSGAVKNRKSDVMKNIDLVCYDIFIYDNPFKTECQKIEFLKNNNFKTVNNVIGTSAESIIEFRDNYDKNAFPYYIDGIVLKQNLVDLEDQKKERPFLQHAFKWKDEGKSTILRKVEWNRSGIIFTPVAVFDSIEIEGSMVSRASLSNPSLMLDLGLKINDEIEVTKRGMIIPKVERVIFSGSNSKEIEFPTVCPLCGGKLSLKDKLLVCTNEYCPGLNMHQINCWINKLDAKGFGPALKKWLWDNGVDTIPKLYDAELIEPLKSQYYSPINFEKAFKSLYSKRELTLSAFLGGLDIKGIGERVIATLEKQGLSTIEDLYSCKDFSGYDNWGKERSIAFIKGLEENKNIINSLLNSKAISIIEPANEKSNVLSEKSFCITGKLNSLNRDNMENLIKDNGGKVLSTVSKNLDYLITNTPNSGSSKNVKAKKFNVKIITEEEFLSKI